MPGARVAKSARAQVWTRVRVLRGDRVGMGAGDLGLEIEDALGARLGVGHAHQGQHRGDIGAVAGADLDHLRRVGEIIIAVGQAEAALQQIGEVAVRLLQALGDEDAEQILGAEAGRVERIDVGAHACAPSAAESARRSEIAAIRARQRLQRRGAARVDRGAVEIGGIIIGDLARRCCRRRDCRGRRR